MLGEKRCNILYRCHLLLNLHFSPNVIVSFQYFIVFSFKKKKTSAVWYGIFLVPTTAYADRLHPFSQD